MEMRLEVVPLPVTDVDASIAFYVDQVGFVLDHDVKPGNGMRVVQLTPPGSACSVVFGTGMGDPERAARVGNRHRGVAEVSATHQELTGRGVDVSEIKDLGGVKYAFFADPDGNSWALQEIPKR
jgi:catechol 2,3-dioxygenase-like lactoylglutathione lyase family enzyme